MRVAAYTSGKRIPGSRYRCRQYIPRLREHDIHMHEFVARFGSYPPLLRTARPLWGVISVAERLAAVGASHKYDLTFLQRELISTYRTWEWLTRSPRIFDVDDAVWLHKRGANVEKIIAMCDRVLCGNTFLANVCEQWHQSVHVLPTGVDTDRYCIAETQPSPERPVIGWSGSSAGAKYLLSIEASLATVLERNKRSTLRVVSDIRPEFRIIPDSRIEYIRWSPTNEVRTIQEMTVGLMPLDDSQWSRGKCSYKMLLYMSCGRPVVVSPVGMNAEVLCEGEIGYGARTHDEWVDAIEQVLADNNNANRMGQIGRGVVVSRYSLHTLAPQLVGHFRACLNN